MDTIGMWRFVEPLAVCDRLLHRYSRSLYAIFAHSTYIQPADTEDLRHKGLQPSEVGSLEMKA